MPTPDKIFLAAMSRAEEPHPPGADEPESYTVTLRDVWAEKAVAKMLEHRDTAHVLGPSNLVRRLKCLQEAIAEAPFDGPARFRDELEEMTVALDVVLDTLVRWDHSDWPGWDELTRKGGKP